MEEETDETIRLTRLAADKEVESHRAEVDLEKEQRLDGTDAARLVDSLLTQEREGLTRSTLLNETKKIVLGHRSNFKNK